MKYFVLFGIFMLSLSTQAQELSEAFYWKHIYQIVSTPHPYNSSTNQTFTVERPGATKIALYFAAFESEGCCDKLKLYNREGTLLQTLAGTRKENFYSDIVDGDYIEVVFTSDSSIQGHGFDLLGYAYKD